MAIKTESKNCLFFGKKAPPSDKTRDLILEEAKKQFCEKGFEGASVRDICDVVKANVSAIKYHFGGKEGLYRECFQQFGEGRLSKASEILTHVDSFEELKIRIKMFAEDILKDGLENSYITKMLCREIEIENPLIQDIFENTFLQIYVKFAELITDAQKKGFIRQDLDPLITVSVLFHTLTATLRTDHVGLKHFNKSITNDQYREKFITNIISIFLDGIKTQEQKS